MARPFDHIRPKLAHLGPDPGRARAEVLFLHGAWAGSWIWTGLAEPVAKAGYAVYLLDLPGHGKDRWRLPGATGLNDYAQVAMRAAQSLHRPILVGHSMGGWLAQKILERADLPAALLAPVPGRGMPLKGIWNLLSNYPGNFLGGLAGKQVAIKSQEMFQHLMLTKEPVMGLKAILPLLSPEPPRVMLELGLGLARAKPRPGRAPRMVVADSDDYFLPLKSMSKLAWKLQAHLEVTPGRGHLFWLADGGKWASALLLEFFDHVLSFKT